ncbi:hypothetical protein ABPG74_006025 [Tetrahymena malaccensis]
MNFASVKQLLLNHKNFQVLDEQKNNILKEDDILIVEDRNGNQFCLNVNNFFDANNDIKNHNLRTCNLKMKSLEQCNHPNIIKIIDHFIIENYFFILMEKCQNNLSQWLKDNFNKEINEHIFTNITLQILKGVQYLHKNQMYLNNISLNSIRIDSNNVVKIWSFSQLDPEDNLNIKPKSYNSDYQAFYYPNEIINEFNLQNDQIDSSQKANISIQLDVHSVCGWIYELSGADQEQLYFYETQQILELQPKVSFQINIILQKLAQFQKTNQPIIDIIEQAIELFENLEKQNNNNEKIAKVKQEDESDQILLNQVLQEFEIYEYINCIDLLRDLILKNPTNDLYLAWMGRVYNATFEYNQSDYWSQQALKLNQYNWLAYYNLGNSRKNNYQLDEAVFYYKKALQITEQNDLVYNNLGVAFTLQKKHHQSIEAYTQALKIQPTENDYLFNKSRSKSMLSKYESALKIFKQLLNLYPNDQQGEQFFKQSKKYI